MDAERLASNVSVDGTILHFMQQYSWKINHNQILIDCIYIYPKLLHYNVITYWEGKCSVFASSFSSSSRTKRIGVIALCFSIPGSFTIKFSSMGLDVFTGPCAVNGESKPAKKKKKNNISEFEKLFYNTKRCQGKKRNISHMHIFVSLRELMV